MKELASFEINRFPTHLRITNNKIKADRYIKVNGQSIYNGKLNTFTRNILMGQIHDIAAAAIRGKYSKINIKSKVFVEYEIHTVINHASISRRNGEIKWKEPKPDYVPSNDIDNMMYPWVKGINDAMVKTSVLIDDNISQLTGYSVKFVEVKHLDDRKISVSIKKQAL